MANLTKNNGNRGMQQRALIGMKKGVHYKTDAKTGQKMLDENGQPIPDGAYYNFQVMNVDGKDPHPYLNKPTYESEKSGYKIEPDVFLTQSQIDVLMNNPNVQKYHHQGTKEDGTAFEADFVGFSADLMIQRAKLYEMEKDANGNFVRDDKGNPKKAMREVEPGKFEPIPVMEQVKGKDGNMVERQATELIGVMPNIPTNPAKQEQHPIGKFPGRLDAKLLEKQAEGTAKAKAELAAKRAEANGPQVDAPEAAIEAEVDAPEL